MTSDLSSAGTVGYHRAVTVLIHGGAPDNIGAGHSGSMTPGRGRPTVILPLTAPNRQVSLASPNCDFTPGFGIVR